MSSVETYENELKVITNRLGNRVAASKLGVTERTLAYWTSVTTRKTPTRELQRKIHELFSQLNSGTVFAPAAVEEPEALYSQVKKESIYQDLSTAVKTIATLSESIASLTRSNEVLAMKISLSETGAVSFSSEAGDIDRRLGVQQAGVSDKLKTHSDRSQKEKGS